MKRYALGFCFVPGGGCILIEKRKPDWQKGLVNGLGGHVEEGENSYVAMAREFEEEAGIETNRQNWRGVLQISSLNWYLDVFTTRLDYTPKMPRECDEGIVSIYTKPPPNMERTAHWLYWLCRDPSMKGCSFNRVPRLLMEPPTIVEALKLRMDQAGWNQSDLANALGTQPSHISEVLNGKRPLSPKMLKRAYKLGVPAKILLGGE